MKPRPNKAKQPAAQQMDFAKAAEAAVLAQRQLDQLVQGYNARHHNPKMYRVDCVARWITDSERLFKFLADYRYVLSNFHAKPNEEISIYFEDREAARMARDIINDSVFSEKWRNESRHPDDFTGLCQIHKGPDHPHIYRRAA